MESNFKKIELYMDEFFVLSENRGLYLFLYLTVLT